jgi:hypothetical protein
MLLSVLLFLVAALSPHLSLSKPKKEIRQPKEIKLETLMDLNIDTLMCLRLRYHILYVSSIVQKGFIHGHDTLPLHGENHSAIV